MKNLTSFISYREIMLLLSAGAILFACLNIKPAGSPEAATEAKVALQNSSQITVTPDVPADIFSDGTPAFNANITQAANFAWNEFIALNWPAVKGTRDVANINLKFGSQGGDTPLVWHTFRHKVEIYPGNTAVKPPGYNPSDPDLGYSATPPQYLYDPGKVGTTDGQVMPYNQPPTPAEDTPFINLDEKNEIGVATMYAGVSDNTGYPDPQILFLAKANKQEYVYAGKNNWFAGGTAFDHAKSLTAEYVKSNGSTPPPGARPFLISFPYGTIEIKSAWRRLNQEEKESGRFYSTTVRYYVEGDDKLPRYVDETFGMLALHIIHKTPTAPYFIYATFEQADNILTTNGDSVEDVNGKIVRNGNLPPTNPPLKVTNATPTSPQMFSPMTANSIPGKSLFYRNVAGYGTPSGTFTYNRRYNSIPPEIIATNQRAHEVIDNYNRTNNVRNSPWPFYKLVNVQWRPMHKPAGVDYTGPDRASYYLSNSVVESDYTLQMFSGEFNPVDSVSFTTTDFSGSTSMDIAYNAYYRGTKYLMGGCMGCHGNATNGGADYSFILGKPVAEPEYADTVKMTEDRLKSLVEFLKSK